ncbi:MAG: anhydro-N-acetylmuramic acid kinase [Chroococcidiopsidaceae cyanobacterium CP_BM_ER_R8_30]|nr:anhydro-N-acetylmuramic acid kinase [Chroococcidiopsidaceae cyanobacterium CP_BM_ER_R8_30]
MTRVIGLISGTSVDGIDAALIDVVGTDWDLKVELLAGATYPYPSDLRQQILAVCGGAALSMAELAELDDAIALVFAQAAQNIQSDRAPAELIGSHGQTVYHRPPGERREGWGDGELGVPTKWELGAMGRWGNGGIGRISRANRLGYSLQLGRGAVIAQLTGIPCVSNFRSADIAAGGQGAPLVSKVDAYLLSHLQASRCVQNVGGIGNVTYLPTAKDKSLWEQQICGWDTGPGNTLLDLAVQHFTNGAKTYDQDGKIAATGTPCKELVEQWLQQDYFQQLPPKSTGREHFSSQYLHQCLAQAAVHELEQADLLATLTELTAASIAHSYQTFLPQMPQQVLLCGGGSRNLYLRHRLEVQLESVQVLTTDEVGLSADFKEAIAFAILAYWRQLGIPGNLPQVTGASQPVLLGDVHPVHGGHI